jgi:hypothetical protein
VTTADVQEVSCRRLALDQIEKAARGLAPPLLLTQVGVVGHPPIELGQLFTAREPRLVNRPAVATRVEIPMLARVMVCRRHQLRREPRGATRVQEPELPPADVACLLGHGSGGTHTTGGGRGRTPRPRTVLD